MTANLVEKIVKTEFLEIILSKGCTILTISNSTIDCNLSSNIKSQLGALDLSQSSWTRKWSEMQAYCQENIDVIEKLLSLCCSLQQLKMEGLMLTSNMAARVV